MQVEITLNHIIAISIIIILLYAYTTGLKADKDRLTKSIDKINETKSDNIKPIRKISPVVL